MDEVRGLRLTLAMLAAFIVAMVAVGGIMVHRGRERDRLARTTFADFRVCAVGAPLASGETPASRLAGIEASLYLAGHHDADWPARCAPYAAAVARSDGVAAEFPTAAAAADRLNELLQPSTPARPKEPPTLGAGWLDEVLDAATKAGADGAPTSPGVPVAPRALAMVVSVEELHERTAHARAAPSNGGPFKRNEGDVTCSSDDSCACTTPAGRIHVAPRHRSLYLLGGHGPATESDDIELTFPSTADPRGPVVLHVPSSHDMRITMGKPVLVCRGAEAAFSWAVSHWAGDRDVHELHRARCTAAGCVETTTGVSHLGLHWIPVGMEGSDYVQPPFIADLGASTVLAWQSAGGYLARIAPFEALDGAETRLLDPNAGGNHWLDDLLARDGELRIHIGTGDHSDALVFHVFADGKMTLDPP
jgi:hypothetical protein